MSGRIWVASWVRLQIAASTWNTRTSSQLWIVCHILVANPEPPLAVDGEFPLSQVEKEMISRFPTVT